MKVIGVIPARMDSQRFPGKPLYPILDRPMISHVFDRAKLCKVLDSLFLSSCDIEIADFAKTKNYEFIESGSHHVRALDRVAEVGSKLNLNDEDIIINIQGDEPMFHPEMIDKLIEPLLNSKGIKATVLGMEIINEKLWKDPDTVKIIHNSKNEVLFTSRAPLPYGEYFSLNLKAKRIFGLFAFKYKQLKEFSNFDETFLEKVESCDSNRILDMKFVQTVVPYSYIDSFSVDKVEDISLVEKFLVNDKLWGKY